MTAYSFRPRFVAPILAGTKCQTIRADRKRHARPGEELQLYTGMRTKQCRLIARVTCQSVQPIYINFVDRKYTKGNDLVIINDKIEYPNCTGGEEIYRTTSSLNGFARRDGFENWADMRRFWEAAHDDLLDWYGVIITWKPMVP